MKALKLGSLTLGLLFVSATSLAQTNTNCLPAGTLPTLPVITDPTTGNVSIDFKNLDPNILSAENGFGGWSGSGGDTHNETDNTWFVGTTPVSYCLRTSDDYPFSKDELRQIVTSSIQDWASFFRKYRMINAPLAVDETNFSVRLPDGQAPTMTLNFKEVNCEGSNLDETPGEKLIFFFGLTNSAIKVYQNFNTENAYGLAIRPKYNHKTRRNGGYVWVKEFERSEETKLKHMVLHELGHVFGMRHDSVFVMSEDVVDELENKDLFVADYFGEIESAGWKYRYLPNDPATLTSNKGRRFKEELNGNNGTPGDWIDLDSSMDEMLAFGGIPKKWKKPHKPKPHNPHPGNPGHKPPQHPKYGLYKCDDEAYMPNSLLPNAIVKNFELRAQGCHKITFNRLNLNSQNENLKNFEIELSEPQGGKNIKFKGTFSNQDRTREDDLGPGVYTVYKLTKKMNSFSRLMSIRLPFDREEDELPVKGKFEYMGKTFAAQIFNDKGPIVQIFIPQSNRWWTLRSVHACQGNGPCSESDDE